MSALPAFIQQGGDNLVRNVTGMWDGMRLRDYIRIIVIVGAYLLVRPYLIQLAAKIQAREYAKHESKKNNQSSNQAKLSPNQLRDGNMSPVTSKVDGKHDSITSGAQLGKKGMKRQSQIQSQSSKKNVEKCESKGLESEDNKHDEGIYKYLVDYVEGEDGW